MKYFSLLLLLISWKTYAQPDFPNFLEGTWKIEGQETYEHWDKLSDTSLKGFSYTLQDDCMTVIEYLDINQLVDDIVLSAVVLGQNDRKEIEFRLSETVDGYAFSNPDHDFPKRIVYKPQDNSEMHVEISDGMEKKINIKMSKQSDKTTKSKNDAANPNYDRALAERLGADDYGMKSFYFVILKTGPNQTEDKTLISESFRGHLDNINRLVAEKKMIVAGPFGQNENDFRGIFILENLETIEETRALMQTDPAIKAGLLAADIYPWYGSAALSTYLDYSDKIWKVKP